MTRTVVIVIFSVLFSAGASGQEFPWDIFQARTLDEIIAATAPGVRPGESGFFATDEMPSKVRVTFTGQSRPIVESRHSFIDDWFGLYNRNKDIAALYQREYLYKEGSREYWLPTSSPITKYFAKELKAGDEVTLYLIRLGAYRQNESIDCVLLVEEYQK